MYIKLQDSTTLSLVSFYSTSALVSVPVPRRRLKLRNCSQALSAGNKQQARLCVRLPSTERTILTDRRGRRHGAVDWRRAAHSRNAPPGAQQLALENEPLLAKSLHHTGARSHSLVRLHSPSLDRQPQRRRVAFPSELNIDEFKRQATLACRL